MTDEVTAKWRGMSRVLRLVALLAVLVMIGAACTSSSSDDESGDDEPGDTAADDSVADDPAADDPAADDPAADDGAAGDPAAGDADADDAAADDTTDDTGGGELTASARGVTPESVFIGVSMLDFEFLVESNLAPQGWGDQQLVYQTYIDDLNARGGINGRMVEAIYEFYSPLGTTEAEAACVALTEDNEVFAVLGGFLGPSEPANTCITGTQETILIGGRQTAERRAESNAPWFEIQASRDRRLDIFLSLLDSTGRLEGAQVAVVGGIATEEEFNSSGDVLRSFGVEPVLEILNDSPEGDIPAENAAWEVIAERIRQSDADTLLIIGSTSAAIRNVSLNGLDVEMWAVDSDNLNNLGESVVPDMAQGVLTVTGLTDDQIWVDPETEKCKEIFYAANPDVPNKLPSEYAEGEDQWFTPIYAFCRDVKLLELLATPAGADLTHESFAGSVTGLSEFALPGIPFASLGPDKFDAGDTFLLAEFDATASETGEIVPISDPIDVTP
ncbi:MAG: ABC transporter substrate-binding protein [Acidimicrobiia bacterium]|nr:ABC transporter substrate-binding protein [Acidimicrobiia bacterium]